MPKEFVAHLELSLFIDYIYWERGGKAISAPVWRGFNCRTLLFGIVGMFCWTHRRGIIGSTPSRRYDFPPTLPENVNQ